MTVFFTSDTHFGDHRTLNLYKRPFASTAEMDEALVESWNAVVADGDIVWHLGDFARTAKRAAEILPRLNGEKHLVSNHVLANFDRDDIGWLKPLVDAMVQAAPLLARDDDKGFMSKVALLTQPQKSGPPKPKKEKDA